LSFRDEETGLASLASAVAIGFCKRRGAVCKQLANLLSASRFVLGAVWLTAFLYGCRRPEILGSIVLGAAISDFVDGRVARQMGCADGFGRWLDSLADVVFVLTVLTCEARAGAIPSYIPALIAVSFAQYAIDSVVISDSSTPVKSRLGHWGGVINFALVLLLAFAPPPLWPGMLVREASPLIAVFYLAAIVERVLGYDLRQRLEGGPPTVTKMIADIRVAGGKRTGSVELL
jgi:phosphatidylglycerophosphate synthase